jgi:hypothetical protein
VGRVLLYILSGFVPCLARILGEPDSVPGEPFGVLLQGLILAVDEGVHRKHQHGPDAGLFWVVSHDRVVDGDKVGQALAGTCARGDDVVLAPLSGFQSLLLVLVEADALSEEPGGPSLPG